MSELEIGNVIVIEQYRGVDGIDLTRHSFIVLSDDAGTITGLEYDFIASVMSSFKNDEHRRKKLKYKENLEVLPQEITVQRNNNRTGYIKADEIHYFKLENIEYRQIGTLSDEVMENLFLQIQELDVDNKLKLNIHNL